MLGALGTGTLFPAWPPASRLVSSSSDDDGGGGSTGASGGNGVIAGGPVLETVLMPSGSDAQVLPEQGES